MAKLTCNDGTVINISAETENELRKAFEKKVDKRVVASGTFGGEERVIIRLSYCQVEAISRACKNMKTGDIYALSITPGGGVGNSAMNKEVDWFGYSNVRTIMEKNNG